jgi:hypothetical protein
VPAGDDASFRQVLKGMADCLIDAGDGNQALAVLRKDELSRERLEFTIRGAMR